MWSIVASRFVVIASLGLPLFAPSLASATQSELEAKVVARLYKEYAWQAFSIQSELFGKDLMAESRATLEKYFAPDLAKLLVADTACQIRMRGQCNLDFDPLFDSQDPRIADLEVSKSAEGKVRVRFKDPVTDQETAIDFALIIVDGKWRIADVVYAGHPQQSLKKILSRSLHQN